MRHFHINQLPQDRIFILLNKKFHITLFKAVHKTYSFNQLNKIFSNKLNYNTYKKWRYRMHKPHRNIPQFIPLWFIIKIPFILKRHNLIVIEKNILAYKGPSSSSIIWKPNLPLKEDGKLLKILAHFMGDGHVGGAFGTKLPKGKSHSEYRNYNSALLDQFEKDIQVFGKIKVSKDYNHGHVLPPNLIGYIIEHLYKIKTGTFVSKIPKKLYKLNKKELGSFLRAFFDDEGHVYDNHIDVYSANKILLKGIMKIFKLKFKNINISNLKVNYNSQNPKYYFYVLSNSKKAFLKEIGFDHPQKKTDLIFNINRVKKQKYYGKKEFTKNNILNILKVNKLSAKDISRKLYLSHESILSHLNNLQSKNLVNIIGKGKHNENIWSLNIQTL